MKPTVIALGFFDGVHRGHGALLRRTVEVARQLDATPAAFTFDRPPKEVVTGKPVPLINSTQERQELMERLYGIQQVIVAPFDHEMMTMPWEDFITELLVKRYGAVHLVAGHDYHFGHKNAGDPALLQQKCRELGLGCDIIPKVEYDGITVSSTYIRQLVRDGELERAAEFLGHRHCLSQTVSHGFRFGRTIGIPTINFTVPDHVLVPEKGVYVTRVYLPNGSSYAGVTNVGTRPTVSDSADVSIEDYSPVRFIDSYDDSAFNFVNAATSAFSGRAYNYRIGAEFNLTSNLAIRGGANILTSAEKYYMVGGEKFYYSDYNDDYYYGRKELPGNGSYVNDIRYSYSLGLGYNPTGSFFADFAVRWTTMPSTTYQPYYNYTDSGVEYYSPLYRVNKTLLNAVLTLGWRF